MDLTTIIIFIASGIVLLGFEIFLPGGILGLIGFILLSIGVISAFFTSPITGLLSLLIALISMITLAWLWLKYFHKTTIGKHAILENDAANWNGFDNSLSRLEGKLGISQTILRPSGIILINEKRYDAVTRGELIKKNTEVEVLEVHGNRIVVEKFS